MPDLIDPDEVSHWWGGDLVLSATGDLGRVNLTERSKQRVLRRLLTNAGDYIDHVTYGAGIPADVGTILDMPKLRAKIRGQMLLEESVVQTPEPVVVLKQIRNGVEVSIQYLVAPEKTPAALSFTVDV